MFFHVLLMRFNADVPPGVDRVVESYAERVRRECKGLVHYHYGPNVASRAKGYDRTIVSAFESSTAHDDYQVSPVHQEMKALMNPLIADIVVSDLEVPRAGVPGRRD